MPKADRTSVNLTPRILGAAVLCALCLSVLIGRLWYLQIVRGSFFRDRSENNRLRTVFIPSPRGVIADRHGEALVRNRPSFNIELVVEDAPNVTQVVTDLAALVGEEPQVLQERLDNQNKRRRFEPKVLLRDVSRDLVAQVSAQRHRLPGVIVSVVPVRDYPYGSLSAHTVGYLREISAEQLKSSIYQGYRAGDMVGQGGIEAALENYLRGERGAQAVIVNARGTKIGEAFFQPEIPGSDVHLTIDRQLQQVAERALEGRRGAVVAMHAQTGEILALASAPTFEPALFTGEIPKDVWADLTDVKSTKLSNRALQGAFPPGSVFKMFVAAAALSEGVADSADRTFCPGFLRFGARQFRCHKHSGHGSTNLYDALVQSCDVYFYTVGQRLGVDRIYEYAHDLFGFGEPVNLEGFDENSGLVPSTKWKATYFRNPSDKRWYPGETLPVAIGQGAVLATPVQVARAMAALVNGGKLLKPRVVSKIVASDGRVLEQRADGSQVMRVVDIDPAILAEIKRGMVGVVEDKRGTGKRAALPKESGIGVGGKTGTAQVASREAGIESEDHAWFAGFAPTDNPQIVVVALIENGGHGGEVAAPVTRAVLMQYFGLQEPRVITQNAISLRVKKMPGRSIQASSSSVVTQEVR
jgi:penicillin-binding protein 2